MGTDAILDAILKREGGYVDHPADKGGPTNFGITLATLSAHRGRAVTPSEVRLLTEEEARAIYTKQYVEPFLGLTHAPLLELVVDMAVNHGPLAATRMLQKALGIGADGIFGAVTLASANQSHPRWLYARVIAERVRKYGRIITQNPTQAVFASGWMNRAAEFIDQLADMGA